MKFYVEEITVMKDGTSAHAITEKANENEAIANAHQVIASAIINENVETVHAVAKNNFGGEYANYTWVRTETVTEW